MFNEYNPKIVEKKIQELRKIADLKDEYYEIIVKKD